MMPIRWWPVSMLNSEALLGTFSGLNLLIEGITPIIVKSRYRY